MNNTTVKRGIGAVVLALIAAGLLAFLLKDKAAQRQEVVETAIPGTTVNSGISTQSTRLPTLTTDNSGNGNVIANAGNGSGTNSDSVQSPAAIETSDTGNTASTNSDGTIIASAAALGTAGAAAAGQAATNANKSMDFSVKPNAAQAPKASSEFLELDLVNNGTPANNSASTSQTKPLPVPTEKAAAPSAANTDQGIVIASTSPKSNARANTVQPRLIGEKRSAPVKSASTAKVIKKVVPAKKAKAAETNSTAASTTTQAKNGYAIQLLATSSQSRANNLKNVMAGEGYPAYVTKTKQNGKTLYRVRIGQYAVKSEAVKAQASMKRRYKKNTNVNRSAVVAR